MARHHEFQRVRLLSHESHMPNMFATKFLTATHFTVGKWMRHFESVNPDAKLYLSRQYVIPLSWSSVLSRKWKYVSVTQLVKDIDDSGVSTDFRCDTSTITTRYIVSGSKNPPDKSTQNEKSTQKKKWGHSKSLSSRILRRDEQWMLRDILSIAVTDKTIVLCTPYSTCENLLILCKVYESISRVYFRIWHKIDWKVASG